MLFEIILAMIYGFIYWLTFPIRIWSDVTLPEDFGNALTQSFQSLSGFSFAFPVGTLIAVLTILLFFEFGYFTYKGIMWIIRRIPTQS